MYVNISLLDFKLTAIQSSHTEHYSVIQKYHILMIGIHLIVSHNYSNWNQILISQSVLSYFFNFQILLNYYCNHYYYGNSTIKIVKTIILFIK